MEKLSKKTEKIQKIMFMVLIVFVSSESISQDYRSAVGVRIGGYPAYTAVNFKELLNPNFALDLSLGKNSGSDRKNFSAQVLFEYENTIGRNTGFSWYAGGGPTGGYWIQGEEIARNTTYSPVTKFWLGVNSVIGAEYTFPRFPLNFSADAGPSLIAFPYVHVNFMANFSMRYVISGN